MNNKILSLIGFSKRAGKIVSGTNRVLDSILNRKAKLIILASDVSENTKDKFKRLSLENSIKCFELSNIEELSKLTGEVNKGTYAILDKTFSEPIINLMESNN